MHRLCLHSPRLLAAALACTCAVREAVAIESAVPTRKVVTMVRAARAPIVDGRLDEEVWSSAATIEDLRQVSPDENAEPTERTVIYVLYDAEALYVAARMFDNEPQKITAKLLKQGDYLMWEDHLMVNLHPFDDGRTGYRFEVNPNGVRLDGLYQATTRIFFDWDGIWTAGARRDAEGWTAEMAIPFKTLSFDPRRDTWGINFSRNIGRKGERDGWMSHNRQQNPGISGTARGFRDLDGGVGLDLVPTMSVRSRKSLDGEGSAQRLEPSLDLFYKIAPTLNGTLTFNTDFSATDVDDRQINLTRFALFFPEQRDFFLKDADLFDFGRFGQLEMASTLPSTSFENGRPFFSRRIGLSAAGQPVDLDYGGKLSGRLGPVSLGMLGIRQAESGEVDARELFVARAAVNLRERVRIGLMLTDGDPLSESSNALTGIDFSYLNAQLPGGRVFEGDAWYMRTETEGVMGGGSAWSIRAHMPNGTGLRGGVALKEIGQSFNPALGFLNRRGSRDAIAEIGYTARRSAGPLRSLYSGIDAERIELLLGGLQTQIATLRALEIETRRGDSIDLRYTVNHEVLDQPFEISPGIVIPAGDYSFGEFGLGLRTPEFLTFSPSLAASHGDFFAGRKSSAQAGFAWRPSMHFRTSMLYDVSEIDLPQGSFTTRLARLGLDVVFSNALSWVNLVQYDNVSDSVGISSRVHWMPKAGRETFFALDHNLMEEGGRGRFRSVASEAAIKLRYTLRF